MLQLIDLWELSHSCLGLLAKVLCKFGVDLRGDVFCQHFLHLLGDTLRLLLDILLQSLYGLFYGLKFGESKGSTHLSKLYASVCLLKLVLESLD